MIKRYETGPRMSQSVTHNGTVYLAGQIASGDSVLDQTRACLGQIDTLLAQAGSSRENILQTTIYLADISDFAQMNQAWDEWIPAPHTPARATVEAALAAPEYRVEIVVIAAQTA